MLIRFMEKRKLLITESLDFSLEARSLLEAHYDVVIKNIQNENELLTYIEDVEVVFVRLKFYISKEVIDKAVNLKYILTATTGLDHIDVDYFENKGGQVVSLKDAHQFLETISSTAEHTWGLMLALIRRLPQAVVSVNQGFWDRDRFKGHNLQSLKLGILGLGRVGKQVEHYAVAFGMEIGFYDSNPSKKSERSKSFFSAENLLAWSDIVSVHIPLNEENVDYLNANLLMHLKPNAYLINTSRGLLVDEFAIETLIKQKHLAGYAADVLANEIEGIIGDNPLVHLARQGYNVILTPHIAGCTYESMKMTEDFVANLLLEKYLNIEKK